MEIITNFNKGDIVYFYTGKSELLMENSKVWLRNGETFIVEAIILNIKIKILEKEPEITYKVRTGFDKKTDVDEKFVAKSVAELAAKSQKFYLSTLPPNKKT